MLAASLPAIWAAATAGGALLAGLVIGAAASRLRAHRQLAELGDLRARREEAETHIDSLKAELRERDAQITELGNRLAQAREEVAQLKATLESERAQAQEKVKLLEDAKKQLSDQFKALSQEALQANNQAFLEQAKQHLAQQQEKAQQDLAQRQQAMGDLVQPVKDHLTRMETQIQNLEKQRVGAYEGIREQVANMQENQRALKRETEQLVNALRAPQVRGRWGEIQLRRVVEMADMLSHVDFLEQESHEGRDDSGPQRPDMRIFLPGGQTVVVDAKTPIYAYLDAVNAEDAETRRQHMQRHAQQVRTHMRQLGQKAYWKALEDTPDFVVMFLPGENFFSAALEHEPGLIEAGVNEHVIPATPTTLIALLRAVAYGWRQERLAENARQVAELGRELYDRLATMAGHMQTVGKNLDTTVKNYNQAVGSLERSVLPSARRFRDLQVASGSKDIPGLQPVERQARSLQARELAGEPSAGEGESAASLVADGSPGSEADEPG